MYAARRRGAPAFAYLSLLGDRRLRKSGLRQSADRSPGTSSEAVPGRLGVPPVLVRQVDVAQGCAKLIVDQRDLDEAAEALTVEILVGRLARPMRSKPTSRELESEATRLDLAIADAERVAEALSDRLGRGEITLSRYDIAVRPLDERIAKLRAEREALGDTASQALRSGRAGSTGSAAGTAPIRRKGGRCSRWRCAADDLVDSPARAWRQPIATAMSPAGSRSSRGVADCASDRSVCARNCAPTCAPAPSSRPTPFAMNSPGSRRRPDATEPSAKPARSGSRGLAAQPRATGEQ